MMQKTLQLSQETIKKHRSWHLIDASSATLGRIASKAAYILIGKHTTYFSPHADCGDFVIVVNAGKLKVTGRKMVQKQYFKHSGYPSGAKLVPFKRLFEEKPERIIELAVKRMLPSNKLKKRMLTRLKIYKGENHPHAAQNPKSI
ncbi:50S ribosomal protein L13 [Elusimicrobiota bacterium]